MQRYFYIFFLSCFFQSSITLCMNEKFPLPNINFELIDGDEITFKELVNEGPLLVHFWAMWCSPCKKEMYHLDKLLKKYKKYGLNVVCVNTDKTRSIPKAKAYTRQKRYSLKIASDPSLNILKRLNVNVMPTTFIFNNKGEVLYKREGYISGDERQTEEFINSILLNK